MAKKRPLNIFSLAFLDVMSCGFGAVILIFLIVNHDAQQNQAVVNKDLLAEIGVLGDRVAIELNQEVVPKSEYASRQLHVADQIEIIQAVGGG